MKPPAIFSFFSGSGFLDLGFEKNGFEVQFVNEFHKPFVDAYKFSRYKMDISLPALGCNGESIETFLSGENCDFLQESVAKVSGAGNLVGFIGGPPCPDFSTGGKNKGKDGENGKLTAVYVDLITKHKPDYFIFENVKGLWRTKRHREFYDEMKTKLSSSGYLLTDRLTNCIEYGAPQDRDRILLFGVKKGICTGITQENLTEKFNWGSNLVHDRVDVLKTTDWVVDENYIVNSIKTLPENIKKYESLTVEYWFKKNDVENHPNSKHHFIPRAGLAKFQIIREGDVSRKSYKRLHRWRYSPTAAYGNNEVHLHPYKDRRISAAEAMAIQSLPKEFQLPQTMTLSNMFKTIGNGVPYLASSGLARTVFTFLENHVTK